MVRRGVVLGALVAGVLVTDVSVASANVQSAYSGWMWSDPAPQGESLLAASASGGTTYAVGDSGTVLSSTDGGVTWTARPSGLQTNLDLVSAPSASTVVVSDGCQLLSSSDSGAHYQPLYWGATSNCTPDGDAATIKQIDFVTPTDGYLVLSDAKILRTQDGGQTWGATVSPGLAGTSPNQQIAFSTPTTGFAITASGIARTQNSGATWTLVEGTPSPASAIVALPNGTVDALSGSFQPSGLYTSPDSGTTWTANPGTPTAFMAPENGVKDLACADQNTCQVAGISGNSATAIYSTTDGGKTYTTTSPQSWSPNWVTYDNSQPVAVAADGTTGYLPAGATSYSLSGAGLANANGDTDYPGFTRLRAVTGSVASAGGPNGEIAFTANGGTSWTELQTPSTSPIIDTSFSTTQSGYALDSTGLIISTANTGTSWHFHKSVSGATSIDAFGTSGVLISTAKGALELSSDGGNTFATVAKVSGINRLGSAGGTLVAYGSSRAYVSTNQARSWTAFKLAGPVGHLDVLSSTSAYETLHSNGRLYFTSDRGRKWAEVPGIGHQYLTGVAFSNAKDGWVALGTQTQKTTGKVDAEGTLAHTYDGGRTWQLQETPDLTDPALGLSTAGGTAYMLSAIGMLATTGSGNEIGSSSITLTVPRKATRHSAKLTGKISGGLAGQSVELNVRAGSGAWKQTLVTTTAGGRFTATLHVTAKTLVVAQWGGTATAPGAGTPAYTVTP